MSGPFRLDSATTLLFALAIALPATLAAGQDWPTWRGANASGRYTGISLGLDWNDEVIRWKVKLSSGSNSSPVVCHRSVFVTAAEQNGARRSLFAFDRSDGSMQWKQSVSYDETEATHVSNPPCSASPVTDGQIVCASFGSAGAIGCTLDGELLWQRELGKLEHVFGTASSPILHQDLCIMWCGPGYRQFVLAVDKMTGKEVWRHEVPGGKPDYNAPSDCVGSWATPLVAKIGGRDQLIVSAPEQLISLNPASGEVHWTCKGVGKLAYASPVVYDDIVISMSGYHGPVLAVRGTGSGDVTSSHTLWQLEDRQPQRIGSPLLIGDQLFVINENGVGEVFDAKTGRRQLVDSPRVCGQSWGSPIDANGSLLITSLRGEISLLRADTSFDLLARLRLGERVASSAAISEGEVFIRGFEHLFCIRP